MPAKPTSFSLDVSKIFCISQLTSLLTHFCVNIAPFTITSTLDVNPST